LFQHPLAGIQKACRRVNFQTQTDLSFIGEYTDKPSDWVIVRQEGEYLGILNEQADKEAYAAYLADDENVAEYIAQGESWPPSFEAWKEEQYDTGYGLPGCGREYRFFKPYAAGEKEGSEDYKTCGLQDFARMESYERQNWCMTGIKAVAKIQTRASANEDWLCNEVKTGGLWGIESDCGKEYKKEVADGQLVELRNALKAFGFNNRQIDTAFKNVNEVDSGYDS
jgi:hypothetical protein